MTETRSRVLLAKGAVRQARWGSERGVAVRVIKDDRLGFAAATARPGVISWLRTRAAESAAHGERPAIVLPCAPDNGASEPGRPDEAVWADPAGDGGLAGCLAMADRWAGEMRGLAAWRECEVIITERIRTVAVRSSVGLTAGYRTRLACLAVAPPAALSPAGGVADAAAGPALAELDLTGLASRLAEVRPQPGGPARLPPGEYDLLMSPAVTAQLLVTVADLWRRVSRGEALSCDQRLLVVDDGTGRFAPLVGPVDDEGVRRQRNPVVADGALAPRPAACGAAGQPPSTGSAHRATFREPPAPAPVAVRLLGPFGDQAAPEASLTRVHVIRPRSLATPGRDRLIEFAGLRGDGRAVTGSVRVSMAGLLRRVAAAGAEEFYFPLRCGAGGRWLLVSDVPVE